MYGILSYLDSLLYGNRRNILSASCGNDLLAPAPHHKEPFRKYKCSVWYTILPWLPPLWEQAQHSLRLLWQWSLCSCPLHQETIPVISVLPSMVYYPTLIASSMGIGATFSPPPVTMISLLLPPTTRNHPGSISTLYGILSYLDSLLYGNRRNIPWQWSPCSCPPTTRNHLGSISTMSGILSYLDSLLYGNRRNILSASGDNNLLAPAPTTRNHPGNISTTQYGILPYLDSLLYGNRRNILSASCGNDLLAPAPPH